MLPNPLVGAYWACYDDTCPALAATPTDEAGITGYNTIYIFQVLPDGTGGDLLFDCSAVQSAAQLKKDIAAKRAEGIAVLLTFGGANAYLAIDTPAIAKAFLASLEAIIAEIGPVDGLDWDIEGGPLYFTGMASIGLALKAKYGSGFAITMAPGPWDTAAAEVAKSLYTVGALDAVGPQFYEQGALTHAQMLSNVVERISSIWLPAVGGNRAAVILGFELAAKDNTSADYMAPATAVAAFETNVCRGAYVWNSSEESANGRLFLKEVAPAITGAAPPPVKPPHHHRKEDGE